MKIVDDEDSGDVVINGHRVEGWLDDQPCPHCKHHQIYALQYDAYFCPACNVWLQENCGDPGCAFCKARPTKPLPPRASA